MRITDLLRPEAIALGAEAKDKGAALSLLTDLQNRAGCLSDPARYRRDLLGREKQGTTAIGAGVAVPHAKSAPVKRPPPSFPREWISAPQTASPPGSFSPSPRLPAEATPIWRFCPGSWYCSWTPALSLNFWPLRTLTASWP